MAVSSELKADKIFRTVSRVSGKEIAYTKRFDTEDPADNSEKGRDVDFPTMTGR